MTKGTRLRGALEVREGMSVGMATFTIHRNVFAGQFESKLVMSEMPTEAINAIMTINTRCSIGSDMTRHERGITQTVARRANIDIEDRYVRGVTIRTDERIFLRLELVRRQHIARQLVRILPPVEDGKQGIGSVMFLVTVSAARSRIDLIHPAMFGQHVPHLGGDVRMTDHAAVIHGGVFPGCHMTGITIPGDLRMRSNAAQHRTLHGIQRAGTEHRPAARKGISRDGKGRDQRGNNACPRETTQTSSSHTLLRTNKTTSRK